MFLFGLDISALDKRHQLDIGLEALEHARKMIIEQKAEFEKLVEPNVDLPIPLTPVRMFDILCWTTEKWDIRGILKAPYGIPHRSLLRRRLQHQS